MPADIVHEDNPALTRVARKTTPAAALAALGIVYGDLGTSPLYTLQAVVGATGGHFSPEIDWQVPMAPQFQPPCC